MKREEVRARLEEIGIIPVVRVSSAEEARPCPPRRWPAAESPSWKSR